MSFWKRRKMGVNLNYDILTMIQMTIENTATFSCVAFESIEDVYKSSYCL